MSAPNMVDIQRFAQGLRLRSSAAANGHDHARFTGEQVSLFDALEARRSSDTAEVWRSDARWLAITAAALTPALATQKRSLEMLSSPDELDFATCYAVGALQSGKRPPGRQLSAAPDADYSVIVESLLRGGFLDEHPEAAYLHAEARKFIKSVRPSGPAKPGPAHVQIARRLPRGVNFEKIRTLTDLKYYISFVKRGAVHVIGPDIISMFQALLDPLQPLDAATLSRAFDLFEDWGLKSAAYTLLLLRLLGPFPSEKAYLADNIADVARNQPKSALDYVARLLTGEPDPNSPEPRSSDWDGQIRVLLERLSYALHGNSAIDCQRVIVDLYCVDPLLTEFLPWNAILEVVETVHTVSPEALFIGMLMRSSPVQRTSRRIALRAGDGAFIGALTQFVLADPKPDILALFPRLKVLPERAAKALALAVLEPQIFDKVVGAFASRPALGEMAGVGNIHLVRLHALRTAQQRGLISHDYAREEASEEAARARLHLLETSMLSGRVRIPWEAIMKATKALIDGLPPELLQMSNITAADEEIVTRAAHFIAEGVSQHILFDSPVSINQALSDNLRHGIVVPRILRAFADTLELVGTTRRRLLEWDVNHLDPHFGLDTRAIIRLRERTNEHLKNYQNAYLTVRRGAALELGLRAGIEAISKGSLKRAAGIKSIEEAISECTEKEVRSFLADAAERLRTEIFQTLLNDIRAVRIETRDNSRPQTTAFLEGLETNLHAAVEEVVQWIAIAERTEAPPFTLDELVKLELRTAVLRNWDRLTVTAACVDRRNLHAIEPQLRIAGAYFELFQDIVHNLISNAFKYSGLEHRTKIHLTLNYTSKEMAFRCTNDIAAERLTEVIANLDKTAQLARNRHFQQADEDNLSGFPKIRRAFKVAMGRDVTINIPPISGRGSRFVIDIIIRNPPEIWHVD